MAYDYDDERLRQDMKRWEQPGGRIRIPETEDYEEIRDRIYKLQVRETQRYLEATTRTAEEVKQLIGFYPHADFAKFVARYGDRTVYDRAVVDAYMRRIGKRQDWYDFLTKNSALQKRLPFWAVPPLCVLMVVVGYSVAMLIYSTVGCPTYPIAN